MKIVKGSAERYSWSLNFERGIIGGGGNSGFQALNLAVQFGAKDIALAGFDMDDRSGKHWYGRNGWAGANNPDHTNFVRWVKAFEDAAAVLAARRVSVVNLSPSSALRCFPFTTPEKAFA